MKNNKSLLNEELISKINKIIPAERVLIDEPMKLHTTFRIGGPADAYVVVHDEDELSKLLILLDDQNIEHMLVGNGSNFLVSDEGYRGIMIRLAGSFEEATREGDEITVGAAKLLSSTSYFAAENGLAGMEFASGIPGTIGGAVYMNAGAYGGEIKDILVSAKMLSADGKNFYELTNEELELTYRNSKIQRTGEIVCSIKLRLQQDDESQIKERMKELSEKRNSKQPVTYPSAGSTFKRPKDGFAAALIEESGLKGLTVGGAQVSTKHSGFVINIGDATCEDVLVLMRQVRDKVYEDSGIMLEPEVRIIGENF